MHDFNKVLNDILNNRQAADDNQLDDSEVVVNLRPLRDKFGAKASIGWINKIARTLTQLEHSGLTHFGLHVPRPDVAAWWLVQKVQQRHWSFLKVNSYIGQLTAEKNS